MSAPNNSTITLLLRGPDGVVHRFPFRGEQCILGSGPNCHLRLRHPSVAEMHCRLVQTTHGIAFQSKAPIQLNQQPVAEGRLSPQDQLRVGEFLVAIQVAQQTQPAASQPPPPPGPATPANSPVHPSHQSAASTPPAIPQTPASKVPASKVPASKVPVPPAAPTHVRPPRTPAPAPLSTPTPAPISPPAEQPAAPGLMATAYPASTNVAPTPPPPAYEAPPAAPNPPASPIGAPASTPVSNAAGMSTAPAFNAGPSPALTKKNAPASTNFTGGTATLAPPEPQVATAPTTTAEPVRNTAQMAQQLDQLDAQISAYDKADGPVSPIPSQPVIGTAPPAEGFRPSLDDEPQENELEVKANESDAIPNPESIESDSSLTAPPSYPSPPTAEAGINTDVEENQPTEPAVDEESLEFEAPEPGAPVSTLEVLKRMGASVDTDDEVPADDNLTSLESLTAEPDPSPTPSEPIQPAPITSWGGQPADAPADDDESIENYMSRLMERVRGGPADDEDGPLPPVPQQLDQQAQQNPDSAAAVETQPEEELLMDPRSLAPRSPAPEKNRDFAAMRALANDSARSAIVLSEQRRYSNKALGKTIIMILFVVVGFLLHFMSPSYTSLPFFASISCYVTAAVFMMQIGKIMKQVTQPNSDSPTPLPLQRLPDQP